MKTHSRLLAGGLALFVLPFAFAGGGDDKFAKLDADGDGKVTKAEHASGAQKMFAEIDADRDGTVTAAEMDAKHAAKPADASKPDYKPMSSADKIKEIDKNGDGKLTAEEHAAGSDQMFGKMDTNGDGTLSKEECDAGHKKLTNDKRT